MALFLFSHLDETIAANKIEREKWQDGTKKSKICLFYFWHQDNKVQRKFLVVFNIETKCWSFFLIVLLQVIIKEDYEIRIQVKLLELLLVEVEVLRSFTRVH